MWIKYLEFVLTRLFGTGVDTLVLWICSDYLFTSYWGSYVLSPIISFEFAVLSNFLWSYLWIWKMFEFEYTWLSMLIATLIIAGAVIGGIVSFNNSHHNYFAHRKSRKNRHYR